jgi:hypothetical protein
MTRSLTQRYLTTLCQLWGLLAPHGMCMAGCQCAPLPGALEQYSTATRCGTGCSRFVAGRPGQFQQQQLDCQSHLSVSSQAATSSSCLSFIRRIAGSHLARGTGCPTMMTTKSSNLLRCDAVYSGTGSETFRRSLLRNNDEFVPEHTASRRRALLSLSS